MTEPSWIDVDRLFVDRLVGRDDALEAALRSNEDAGLPAHDVAPNQGKLLHVLARACGARSILEVGTLGGYSTIWLARALGEGGSLVTLEIDPNRAAVARSNLARANLLDRVDVRVGPALDSLATLAAERRAPFDFVFIDADKAHNAEYFAFALKLARPGAMIVIDNVVRDGKILDASSDDPSVRGVLRLFDAIAAEPRVTATALQTVGAKGWDGFAIALVNR